MNKEYRIVMYQAYVPLEKRHLIKDSYAFNCERYEYETVHRFHSLCHLIDLTNYQTIDLTNYKPICRHVQDMYVVTEYMIESCYVNDDGEWLDTISYVPIYHYNFNMTKDNIDIQR